MVVTSHLKRSTRGFSRASQPLFDLAPDGVCQSAQLPEQMVSSYLTFSPLPVFTGGLFSVALSMSFRSPGVTRHPALWSSDFPQVITCSQHLPTFLL